ncbi:DUF4112 domain-containing protein, partial [Bradyrhizobium uaiense]|uniref:DUF4112 domain-containing protein n=1 Tax=Bradyrhizobium uaiense TaxID=2594946 RepID=UPI001F26A34E
GLIPVIGDIITTAISLWLVREARLLGAPWHITARMLANVAVDAVADIGARHDEGDVEQLRDHLQPLKPLLTRQIAERIGTG